MTGVQPLFTHSISFGYVLVGEAVILNRPAELLRSAGLWEIPTIE